MSTGGLGAGVRIGWDDVSEHVRHAVGRYVGEVVSVEPKVGGFSPGAALGLRTGGGGAYFLKAVSTAQNPDTPAMYRTEIEVNSWLPGAPCVPRLHWSYDDGDWVALLFDLVDGATPALPWTDPDLDRVLATLADWHGRATPAPGAAVPVGTHFDDDFRGWRRLLAAGAREGLDPWAARHLEALAAYEELWADAAEGDTVVHADLRADNVLLGGGVWFVDWPWAARGAGWLDVVFFAPSAVLQGAPPPGELLARYGQAPSAERLVPVVAALSGMFVERSLEPPPPGLPTLRAYQAAQGAAAVGWLRELTGLP